MRLCLVQILCHNCDMTYDSYDTFVEIEIDGCLGVQNSFLFFQPHEMQVYIIPTQKALWQ